MDYNAPSGSTDANADYVGKTASTIGSKVPPKAVMLPQRELVNLIKAAGLVPANADPTQVAQAIARGVWIGTLGASPNALVGAIGGGANPSAPPVLQSLPTWAELEGVALQTNTSATVNVTIAGIATSGGLAAGLLKKKDGSPPAVGDVPVGVPFKLRPDAAGNFRFVGAVASDGASTTLTPAQSIVVAQAAKSPYDGYPFQVTTRAALTGSSAGVAATAFNGVTFTKQSATSKLIVLGRFQTRSTYAPGQGAGAIYFNLNVGSGAIRHALNSGYPGASAGNTLFGIITGLPAGTLAVTGTMEREDNIQWFTTFNPTSADESGYPAVNTADFVIYEQE